MEDVRTGLHTMIKLIKFESDTFASAADPNKCRLFEIECDITCRDRDGADAEYVIESIQDFETKNFVELEVFTVAEQNRIKQQCQETADDNACDAYQSYAEGAADQAYDRWRDEQMEQGE